MCWQPTSHHGFFPALTCWDRGEVLPLKLPWEPALTCAAGASPSGLCAIPTSPPSHNSPPRVPSPEHLPGLGSWQIFLQQLQKVISHQLPAGSLFSPPCQHTHADWPLLPCVTLPCSEGAGAPVWNQPCTSCTLSFLLECAQLFLGEERCSRLGGFPGRLNVLASNGRWSTRSSDPTGA